MCYGGDEVGLSFEVLKDLRESPTAESYAELLCSVKGWGRPNVGFVQYGEISSGDKVLIAVTNHHERALVEKISQALKRRGAKSVDLLVLDQGEDRELRYDDEIKQIIRTEPWWVNPRWYDYQEKVLDHALNGGYDFLIHGRGGPIPKTTHDGRKLPFKFECIPWNTEEMFLNTATIFPPKLNELICKKTWERIYKRGRGGKVHLTDTEGTDIEFTLNEKYFDRQLDERSGFGPSPALGHMFGHPTPPILPEEDSSGEIAGTTSHLSKPFPPINLTLESGRIDGIRGGGGYGEAWKEVLNLTSDVRYPEFPRKGLFWLWEMAIGSNPKVRRQSNVLMLSSGGNEWERNRSGVIHLGFGTRWRGKSELWASSRGIPYGHLHVHLLLATYEIRKGGRTITVIESGRLEAFDDPEVRELAKKYGDPDELLKEDWVPRIPGKTGKGSYRDYAKDPAEWIRKHGYR